MVILVSCRLSALCTQYERAETCNGRLRIRRRLMSAPLKQQQASRLIAQTTTRYHHGTTVRGEYVIIKFNTLNCLTSSNYSYCKVRKGGGVLLIYCHSMPVICRQFHINLYQVRYTVFNFSKK